MIYLIIFFFLLICVLLFEKNIDRRASNIIYFAQFLVLVLFMTLRYRVGGDGLYYEKAFNFMPSLRTLKLSDLDSQLYQPFWYLLNAIVKSVYDDFTFFQLIHALIINSAFFILINKYCEKRFIAVLFYYVFFYLYFSTEILRESLAVVLFMFAYPLIFKRKYIQYFLLCFCAYMFHAFAMITFLVPLGVLLFRKPIDLRTGLLIFIVMLIAPTLILNIILKVFTFNEYVERQLKYYVELEVNVNGILKNIFDSIPVFMILLLQAKKKRIDPILIPAINFYLMMIILSITVAGAARLSNYFIFFFFMAAINTFLTDSDYKLPKVRSQMIVILLLLVISKSFYYMRDMSKYNYGREAHFYNIYLPYHSVFEPIIDTKRENIFRNSMEENVK